MKGQIAKKCVRRCAQAGRKCSSRCTRYYYVLDPTPDHDGKRKQTWSSGHRTRKEAEVGLAEELQRRNEGIGIANSLSSTPCQPSAACSSRRSSHLT